MRLSWLPVLAGFLVVIAGAATAREYGALATGPRDAYGWVSDAPTQREADYRALRQCGRLCEIRVQFHDTCAAYATGRDGAYGWQRHDDRRRAQEIALDHCRESGRDCRIKVWACTN